MAVATFDELMAFDDVQRETVPIPEWGGVDVIVQSMSGEERAKLEKLWNKEKASADPGGFRAEVIALSVVNEQGQRIIPADRAREVLKKNSAALEPIFEAGLRVSKLTSDDIRDLEKN